MYIMVQQNITLYIFKYLNQKKNDFSNFLYEILTKISKFSHFTFKCSHCTLGNSTIRQPQYLQMQLNKFSQRETGFIFH